MSIWFWIVTFEQQNHDEVKWQEQIDWFQCSLHDKVKLDCIIVFTEEVHKVDIDKEKVNEERSENLDDNLALIKLPQEIDLYLYLLLSIYVVNHARL